MTHGTLRHHRRSVRVKGYDYSQAGAYFVTVCARDRGCVFGDIVDGEMRLNDAGRMVGLAWAGLPDRFQDVALGAFVVMPNHVHGVIVIIDTSVGAGSPRPYGGERPTLGTIVAYFKYHSTKTINAVRQTPGVPVWQRNYYERVVRNDEELDRIRLYIDGNPACWEHDRENPFAIVPESCAIRYVP